MKKATPIRKKASASGSKAVKQKKVTSNKKDKSSPASADAEVEGTKEKTSDNGEAPMANDAAAPKQEVLLEQEIPPASNSKRTEPHPAFRLIGDDIDFLGTTRGIFGDAFQSTLLHFKDLNPEGNSDTEELFLTKNVKQECEQFLNCTPRIIVCGAHTTARNIVINEFLGGTFVPEESQSKLPRILQMKYSEDNYIKITDAQDNVLLGRKGIDLEYLYRFLRQDAERSSKSDENRNVEIGIPSDFLKSGPELYVLPFEVENKKMDQILSEYSQESLHVMIYVIDTRIKDLDHEFLNFMKERHPEIKVFKICVRSDNDLVKETEILKSCEDFDIHGGEPGFVTYHGLQRYALQNCSCKNFPSCYHVHTLSLQSLLRQFRSPTKNKPDPKGEFDKSIGNLVASLSKLIQESVSDSAIPPLSEFLLSQERVYDFLVTKSIPNDAGGRLQNKVNWFKEQAKEESCFGLMKKTIEVSLSKLANRLFEMFEDSRGTLESYVEESPFQSLHIDDDKGTKDDLNEFKRENHRQVFRYLDNSLLLLFSDEMVKGRSTCVAEISELLNTCLNEHGDHFKEMIRQDTLNSFSDKRWLTILHPKNVIEAIKIGLKKRISETSIDDKFAEMSSKYEPRSLNINWRRILADVYLRNVDIKEAMTVVNNKVVNDLLEAQKFFIACVDKEVNLYLRRSDKLVLKDVKGFALSIASNRALLTSLIHGRVIPGQDTSHGSVGKLFELNGNYGEIKDKDSIWMKSFGSSNVPVGYGIVYNSDRIVPQHKNILKPIYLTFDTNNHFSVIMPKTHLDLFHWLTVKELKETMPFVPLEIIQNILAGCIFAADHGMNFLDLRPNNILLEVSGKGRSIAKINATKWQSLSVPYPPPDKMPPFHFAPEVYRPNEGGPISKSEVYSIGILACFIYPGNFTRPDCVNTRNLKKIEEAVCMEILKDEMLFLIDETKFKIDVNRGVVPMPEQHKQAVDGRYRSRSKSIFESRIISKITPFLHEKCLTSYKSRIGLTDMETEIECIKGFGHGA